MPEQAPAMAATILLGRGLAMAPMVGRMHHHVHNINPPPALFLPVQQLSIITAPQPLLGALPMRPVVLSHQTAGQAQAARKVAEISQLSIPHIIYPVPV